MHKGDLIITNKTRRRVVKSMQVLLEERSKAYFNFINSLHSEATKEKYKFCLEKFLNHYRIDLLSFLKLPQQDMTNLIIKYLVDKKVSRQYKNLITATLKHACEINDIVLNWKKIKKFINSEKTGNEIAGRDRGYTHQEIQQILNFSDQRVRTAFLILSSTGIRIGALRTLRVGDLEKIDGDIYKVTVYSGDKEQYITFTTPECTKEIDTYLDFRARHGEKITDDSFLFVKKFDVNLRLTKGKQLSDSGIKGVLDEIIRNCGLRQVNRTNQFKRQNIPMLHGFRKHFTKQFVDSKLNPEIREMLLGHKIGLASCYYRPTEEEMLGEYQKAIDNLTIDPANRLQRKVDTLQVEKSLLDSIASRLNELEKSMK
jgi:integrase